MRTGGTSARTGEYSERGGPCARASDWGAARQARTIDAGLRKRHCPTGDAARTPPVDVARRRYAPAGGCASILRAVRSGIPPPARSALQTFDLTRTRSFGARAPRLCAPSRLIRVFWSTCLVAEPAAFRGRPCLFEWRTVRTNGVSPSCGSTFGASVPESTTVTLPWQPPVCGGLPFLASAAEPPASDATRTSVSSLSRIDEPPEGSWDA